MRERPLCYILDEAGDAVACDDTLAWARWMEEARRDGRLRISQDSDEGSGKEIWISTVFLGVDHSFVGGLPVLWETMVFRGTGASRAEWGNFTRRYTSRQAAVLGHQEVCQEVMTMLRAEAKDQPHG